MNGIRYNTDSATINVNGETVTEEELALGMYARVAGVLNDDGVTGTAQLVEYFDAIKGPQLDIKVSPNGLYTLLTVLSYTVLVHPQDTQFDGTTYATLNEAEWVLVSGERLGDNTLIATRLEAINPAQSENVLFTSAIKSIKTSNDNPRLVLENGITIDPQAAQLEGVSANEFATGQLLRVVGTVEGALVSAAELTLVGDMTLYESIAPTEDQALEVEGEISEFQDNSAFKVAGVTVDGSNATIAPPLYALADGQTARVRGDYSANTLVASELYIQNLVEEGTITNLSVAESQLVVRLDNNGGQQLTLTTTGETQFVDSTGGAASLSLSSLNVDDKVLVHLEHDQEDQLTARSLTRTSELIGTNSNDPAASSASFTDTRSTQQLASLSPSSSDNVIITLGDNLSAGEFGRYDITGTFTPGGTLTLTGQFTASAGQYFNIFDWGSIEAGADFDHVTLPRLSSGLAWDLGDLYSDGIVRIVNTPGDIGITPLLWLDANDTGTIIQNSDRIERWVDRSGNSLDAIQSSAQYRPSLTYDSDRERYGIEFGPTPQQLEINDEGALALNNSATLFVAMKYLSSRSLQSVIVEKANIDISAGWAFYANPNSDLTYWITDGTGSGADYAFAVYDDFYGGARILTFVKDGTSLAFFLDGQGHGTRTQGRSIRTSSEPFKIGSNVTRSSGGDADYNLQGIIYEIIIFDSPLSSADQRAVDVYLLNKY